MTIEEDKDDEMNILTPTSPDDEEDKPDWDEDQPPIDHDAFENDVLPSPQTAQMTRKRWLRRDIEPGQLAEERAKCLDSASNLLVDRLFEYLTSLPPNNYETERSSNAGKNGGGLTLPASAIGWLSTQLYPRQQEVNHDPLQAQQPSESMWMGASMRDRLALLKYLLPRATHLRITSDEWPPPLKTNGKFNGSSSSSPVIVSFVGRDVDLSHLSVHSGVTMETTLNASPLPNIQSFLVFYNQIQNCPRVDLRVFPNLSVLFLDQIPPEWVVNVQALSEKLKLIRTERGCIFDMTRFLFGTENVAPVMDSYATLSQQQTLPPPQPALKALTYLKLNYSGLGELSGLRGRRCRPRSRHTDTEALQGDHDELQPTPITVTVPPPLSRLPNLAYLSLAHNEIRTVKTALAGLSSLPNLKWLDLSFNRIRSMNGANIMLGNVKTLILTNNFLENVNGLEKLYSLETLYLDHNRFNDLADVAGLGNLPDLMKLFLTDNPFIEKNPLKYRVNVLDLFKSTRDYSLLPGATYRNLLQILPVLDGFPASKRELVGLKALTFRRAMPPPSLNVRPTLTSQASSDLRDLEVQREEVVVTEQFKATPTVRPRRVTRKGRKGTAIVCDEDIYPIVLSTVSHETNLPQIEFSAQDVITSLAVTPMVPAKPRNAAPLTSSKTGKVSLNSSNGSFVSFVSLPMDNSRESNRQNFMSETDVLLEQAQATIDVANGQDDDMVNLLDNYSAASLIPRVTTLRETLSTDSLSVAEEEPPSPPKNKLTTSLMGSSSRTLRKNGFLTKGFKLSSSANETTPKVENGPHPKNPFDDATEEILGPESTAKSVSFSAVDNVDYLPQTKVTFPETVWDDELSVPSSLGTARVNPDDFSGEDKYREAEDSSIYDGPEGYKKLSVMVNLDLYFRLFVFSSKDPDLDQSLEVEDDLASKMAVEAAPRIQLRPVDRKVAEKSIKEALGSAKLLSLRETFKKVWQEEVIACGKSAARRVAPCKKMRRGFHGDPVFSDGSILFVAESRKVILCSSDAALYFIPDYDAVSIKQMETSQTRKFPSPIPQGALFQNGVWPHAYARLPIETLQRITIGFSFQSLTLHFAPSSELERSVLGNLLTFIFVTSNRVATVKLLQHLQDLTKETGKLGSGRSDQEVTIDNNDKQVLDALSVAVAPCSVDVVLHYQVLQQRWKGGDRGTVRRACVITDSHIFLLDEDYIGDGSESYHAGSRTLGEVRYSLIDSAELNQIVEVQAASDDPKEITIVIRPISRLQRNHNWRLLCSDSEGAERLVDDARKVMSMADL